MTVNGRVVPATNKLLLLLFAPFVVISMAAHLSGRALPATAAGWSFARAVEYRGMVGGGSSRLNGCEMIALGDFQLDDAC
jgi:hypothetical protein